MASFEINEGKLVKYEGNDDIVTVPDGIKEIAYEAFFNQRELAEVKLPEGLETIGVRAFVGAGIKTITIPSTVKAIGSYAFYGCYRLKEVIVSDGVTEIGESAFAGVADLKQVILPPSIEKISGAFKGDPLDDVPSLKAVDVVEMPEIAKRTATKEQLNVSLIPCLSDNVEALANVLAFQNHANWIKAVEAQSNSDNAGRVFSKAIELISGEGELIPKKASQLVAYALNHFDCIDGENMKRLQVMLKEGGKKLSKATIQFEGDPRVSSALAGA